MNTTMSKVFHSSLLRDKPLFLIMLGLMMIGFIFGSGYIVYAQTKELSVSILDVDTSSFPQIKAPISVTDSTGFSVADLDSVDITVFEDELQIDNASISVQPYTVSLQVVFAIDASSNIRQQGVTQVPRIDEVKKALTSFANNYMQNYEDRVSVIVHEDEITTVVESTPFTITLFNEGVTNYELPPRLPATTPLYDLLLKALDMQDTQVSQPAHKVIVVFSDGIDVLSEGDRGHVLRLAEQNQVVIHTVLLGPERPTGRDNLKQLSDRTGGTYVSLSSQESVPDAIFKRMKSQRAQHEITFRSRLANSAVHALNVTVTKAESGSDSDEYQFGLTVLPPKVRLLEPSSGSIERSSDIPGATIAQAEPKIITVTYEVTWPDGHPRQVSHAELVVNGKFVMFPITGEDGKGGGNWDITDLPDDTYSLRVKVTDELGLQGESTPIEITIGSILPPTDTPISPPTITPMPTVTPESTPSSSLGTNLMNILKGQWLAILAILLVAVTLWIIYRQSPRMSKVVKKAAEEATDVFFPGRVADDRPYLEVTKGDEKNKIIYLQHNETTLGRSAEFARFVFSDRSVSRLHARISFEEGKYVIYDEGSASGTWVNGEQLDRTKGRILQHEDEIELGRVCLQFKYPDTQLSDDDTKPTNLDESDTYV